MFLKRVSNWGAIVSLVTVAFVSSPAHAIDINYSSFIRVDGAFRTTGKQNLNNQRTNPFNNRTVTRNTYLPPTIAGLQLLNGANTGPGGGVSAANDWAVPLLVFDDQVNRGDFVRPGDVDINYAIVRAESEMQIKFNREWRIVGRIRGVFDPGIYQEFDARSDILMDPAGNGLVAAGGRSELYESDPNYFEAIGRNGRRVNPLEVASDDYMIDVPALMLEYRSGNLTVRAGNQQIAWGQAIFFQTLDLPNGLDLRRHSILDRAFEEFSDKRVPRLTLRATYQRKETVFDTYVSKFQPTIFGNPNTTYNVIPSQFTVQENYHSSGYDDKLDAGIRIKTDYGNWGWQAVYVSRYNPGGTFRWAATGLESPVTGAGLLGTAASTAYAIKLPTCDGTVNPTLCRNSGSLGEALALTPFVAQPGGVISADEWFTYAADVRLDGIEGVNAAVNDFPALKDVYATNVNSYEETYNLLNTFFVASGGLRGFIEREYHRESVFGGGLSYVTNSDNEWLNQIIFNLEAQYTPDRMFTKKDLGAGFLEKDEYIASLVVEKWTRWTDAFPAAYLVFQYMHRSESDLVGRHLSGYGATPQSGPTGIGSANYVVLAALQPWPGRKYIFEFGTLIDVKGGVLVQPLLQYNIGKGMIAEIYYNYLQGDAWGDNPKENLIDSVTWADELAVRFKYQF